MDAPGDCVGSGVFALAPKVSPTMAAVIMDSALITIVVVLFYSYLATTPSEQRLCIDGATVCVFKEISTKFLVKGSGLRVFYYML